MKKIKVVFALLLGLSLLFSCKKDDDESDAFSDFQASFSATIDGSAYSVKGDDKKWFSGSMSQGFFGTSYSAGLSREAFSFSLEIYLEKEYLYPADTVDNNPTRAEMEEFFKVGTYQFKNDSVVDGFNFYYTDDAGTTWSTSGGDQSTSNIKIVSSTSSVSEEGDIDIIVESQFNCTLYKLGDNTASKVVKDGVLKGKYSELHF